MWALVPLKLLSHAKGRLAPQLSPEQRQQLVLAMAADVLAALANSQSITHILLISRNHEAKALASRFAAELFAESEGADLPAALIEGIAHACAAQAQGVCIVPADAPLLQASDVDLLMQQHTVCTVVPDQRLEGTNALVLSPPQALRPIFDGRSFQPHLRAAISQGLAVRVFATPRFSLDIDTPEDLLTLTHSAADSHAKTYLQGVIP